MSGSNLNESVIDVCDACGGDGGFCDTYIGRDHEVHHDLIRCEHCAGEGFVLVDAEPAEEFWMEDAQ
jgi:hypothetical protein